MSNLHYSFFHLFIHFLLRLSLLTPFIKLGKQQSGHSSYSRVCSIIYLFINIFDHLDMPGALKYMISLDHPKVPFRGCEAPSLSNLFQATSPFYCCTPSYLCLPKTSLRNTYSNFCPRKRWLLIRGQG